MARRTHYFVGPDLPLPREQYATRGVYVSWLMNFVILKHPHQQRRSHSGSAIHTVHLCLKYKNWKMKSEFYSRWVIFSSTHPSGGLRRSLQRASEELLVSPRPHFTINLLLLPTGYVQFGQPLICHLWPASAASYNRLHYITFLQITGDTFRPAKKT